MAAFGTVSESSGKWSNGMDKAAKVTEILYLPHELRCLTSYQDHTYGTSMPPQNSIMLHYIILSVIEPVFALCDGSQVGHAAKILIS